MDHYDFEQSRERMPIECAFGILVRRFGVLWRPLAMRFDRRAAVIGACMNLHNFCIDHRIAEETNIVNGMGEVQPDRWEKAPRFDKDDRPLDYIQLHNIVKPTLTAADKAVPDRFKRRNEVAAELTRAGLSRTKDSISRFGAKCATRKKPAKKPAKQAAKKK